MINIKLMAQELGISAHTIRYYEKEGMVDIPRDARGIRCFDDKSIDRLKAIIHYRRVGMPLEDIKKILQEFHNHSLSTQLLEKTRLNLEQQIADLQETHHYLVEKIKIHRQLAELEAQGASAEERTETYYQIRQAQAKEQKST